jgi:hypothetical protein
MTGGSAATRGKIDATRSISERRAIWPLCVAPHWRGWTKCEQSEYFLHGSHYFRLDGGLDKKFIQQFYHLRARLAWHSAYRYP